MTERARVIVLLICLAVASCIDIDGAYGMPVELGDAVTIETACFEDMPCWDWRTMGNHMAGDNGEWVTRFGAPFYVGDGYRLAITKYIGPGNNYAA